MMTARAESTDPLLSAVLVSVSVSVSVSATDEPKPLVVTSLRMLFPLQR